MSPFCDFIDTVRASTSGGNATRTLSPTAADTDDHTTLEAVAPGKKLKKRARPKRSFLVGGGGTGGSGRSGGSADHRNLKGDGGLGGRDPTGKQNVSDVRGEIVALRKQLVRLDKVKPAENFEVIHVRIDQRHLIERMLATMEKELEILRGMQLNRKARNDRVREELVDPEWRKASGDNKINWHKRAKRSLIDFNTERNLLEIGAVATD